MTRKPKATSQKTASKSTASKRSDKDKPAARRPAAKPPAPEAEELGEFASPACFAHEVDPAYMQAPPRTAAGSSPESPKTEPVKPQPAAAEGSPGAPKVPPPKPSRVPFNQGPKPGWADRHTKSPHNQGRGRMRVGRPHGRGQGG
jgi:hypothetical protein